MNVYTPAHDHEPFDTTHEANINERYYAVRNIEQEIESGRGVESSLEHAKNVVEDPKSSKLERIRAIQEFERKVDEMKQWRSYFSKLRTTLTTSTSGREDEVFRMTTADASVC